MSRVALDLLYSHSKNVGQKVVGEFCGSPIVTLDERAIDIDLLIETARIIEVNRSLGVESSIVEVLPGEVICPDNIVRRSTTSEAVGESFYAYEVPKGTVKVSIELATLAAIAGEMIYFRPDGKVGDGEFALRYEEAA